MIYAPIALTTWGLVAIASCLTPSDFCGLKCDGGVANTVCETRCEAGKYCLDLIIPAFSDFDKQYVLDIHNFIRNQVALGHATAGGNRASSNMMVLNYDEELEEMAFCWAKQCITGNDPCSKSKRFPKIGQNYFKVTFQNKMTSYRDMSHIYLFITNWYNEHELTSTKILERYETGFYKQFTQIIWAKTTHMGCARVVHDEKYDNDLLNSLDFICNYAPAGNVANQSVYEFGKPASNCPDGFEPNVEYKGLCGKFRILSPIRKTIVLRAGVELFRSNLYVLLCFVEILCSIM